MTTQKQMKEFASADALSTYVYTRKQLLALCPRQPVSTALPLPETVQEVYADIFIADALNPNEENSRNEDEYSLLMPVLCMKLTKSDLDILKHPMPYTTPGSRRHPPHATGGPMAGGGSRSSGAQVPPGGSFYDNPKMTSAVPFGRNRGHGPRRQLVHFDSDNQNTTSGDHSYDKNYSTHGVDSTNMASSVDSHDYPLEGGNSYKKHQHKHYATSSFRRQDHGPSGKEYKDFGESRDANDFEETLADDIWESPSDTLGKFDEHGNFVSTNDSVLGKIEKSGPKSSLTAQLNPESNEKVSSAKQSRFASILAKNTADQQQQTHQKPPSMPSIGTDWLPLPFFNSWTYCDPSAKIQGPFIAQQMHEWTRIGYFTPSLLVKPDLSQVAEKDYKFLIGSEMTNSYNPLSIWIEKYCCYPWSPDAKSARGPPLVDRPADENATSVPAEDSAIISKKAEVPKPTPNETATSIDATKTTGTTHIGWKKASSAQSKIKTMAEIEAELNQERSKAASLATPSLPPQPTKKQQPWGTSVAESRTAVSISGALHETPTKDSLSTLLDKVAQDLESVEYKEDSEQSMEKLLERISIRSEVGKSESKPHQLKQWPKNLSQNTAVSMWVDSESNSQNPSVVTKTQKQSSWSSIAGTTKANAAAVEPSNASTKQTSSKKQEYQEPKPSAKKQPTPPSASTINENIVHWVEQEMKHYKITGLDIPTFVGCIYDLEERDVVDVVSAYISSPEDAKKFASRFISTRNKPSGGIDESIKRNTQSERSTISPQRKKDAALESNASSFVEKEEQKSDDEDGFSVVNRHKPRKPKQQSPTKGSKSSRKNVVGLVM
jgi:hypothetical protein